MKEATGKDPSFSKFYFQTDPKKSDKSWVNENVEAAYLEFERKKQEILAAQNALDGEGEASQPSKLSEMDIWMQSVEGKKKGRVKGLGSLSQTLQNERHKNKKMRKELDLLMKHIYKKSFLNE
ncbi:hypothetical protein R3W88_026709 [Solanum pinnatisectum]|uniref:Uncharacterized protein n=1 Tax=Solanum pinnatisectum TaxID=50273 RepID=A0AAV9LGK8_9SOLN|nr:hypothetical protein R3W88_026709 [Solanum pinnatisectum]